MIVETMREWDVGSRGCDPVSNGGSTTLRSKGRINVIAPSGVLGVATIDAPTAM